MKKRFAVSLFLIIFALWTMFSCVDRDKSDSKDKSDTDLSQDGVNWEEQWGGDAENAFE